MSCTKSFRSWIVLAILVISLSSFTPYLGGASNVAPEDFSCLKERIQFSVKWTFIPLIKTHMETYRPAIGEDSTSYRLVHQAAANTFWNDRMESIVDSNSLLPYQMTTIIKDGGKFWEEKIIFDRSLGRARFFHQNRENGKMIVDHVDIDQTSMDPLAAFYYMRKRLSPTKPFMELEGITGPRRFTLTGKLTGEETIDVSAGTFKTYRSELIMKYWDRDGNVGQEIERPRDNPFTLWVTQDEHRFPVRIRYRLPLGSLWIEAISVKSYEAGTRTVAQVYP